MDPHALAEQLAQETGGRIAFACRDLRSGAQTAHRADERVPTASVIKLPVLLHVVLAARAGDLSWDAPLTLTDAVKVPGTGILKELSAGLALSVRDLCMLMTALSDNTATNMLVDLVGIEAVNATTARLGFPQTRLLRRAFAEDTEASRPFGLGVTTAAETVELLARLAARDLADPQVCDVVMAMLAAQQDRAAIPRRLPDGWHYAGKTGSNADFRADAGILEGPRGERLALAVFASSMPKVDWTVDNPGLLAIAEVARALVAAQGA